MIIKQGKWYVLRNNTILGPVKRINDTSYDFWCPSANFRCWTVTGSCNVSGWVESDFDIARQMPDHSVEQFERLFEALVGEFESPFLASIVCGMVHLNCEKKIEDRHVLKHIIKDGGFTFEQQAEFEQAFYTVKEKDPETYALALQCWSVCYEWQCRQAMHGLGGCEKKTFKELIDKANNFSANQ